MTNKTELCEWDPENDRPAQMLSDGSHYMGCTRPATEVVGAKGQWHLCGPCAHLPRFDRFTVRTHRGAADGPYMDDLLYVGRYR